MTARTEELDAQHPELEGLLNQGHVPFLHRGLPVTIKPSQPASSPVRAPSSDESDQPDVVSLAIGDYGRWQLMITFLLSLFSFPCTFHIYITTFTTQKQEYWCKAPAFLSGLPVDAWINYSQPNGPCSVRDLPDNLTVASILNHTAPVLDTFRQCTEWQFDGSDVHTIISEWNLVCDRAGLTNLAEVVFLIGVGFGGVIGGWISDKFGRKRILMGMAVMQSILAILSILVRSYIQYLLVRFVMGLVSVSVVYAAFVLAVEVVGGKWMTIVGVCNFFPLPVAYIIVSLLSLVLPNWRDLQLTLSLPGCALLILWFILPESPRWLLSLGRTQEAKVILQKAANFNKKPLPAEFDKLLMVHKVDQEDHGSRVTVLFKGALRKRTICLFIAWFSMTIAYYGLLLNIGEFNLGNLHMTSIILAIVEIPAIALAIPILLKAGRRMPIFITTVICGVACVVTELFSVSFDNDWVIIGSLMVGKFAISSTNMMLPIYTAELYPTYVRNLGVGCSQLSAGIALIFIPYLWELAAFSKHLPLSTIAVICVAGGLVVLVLPETGHKTTEHPKIKQEKITTVDGTIACNGTFITDDRGQ